MSAVDLTDMEIAVPTRADLIDIEDPPTFTPITVMMGAAEARTTIETIKGHLDHARRLLLDLEEREGWRALGYASWRACAQAEFGQSQAYLYRQLAAAKIERDLDSPIGEIPESHLRPLAKAAPADRPKVIERATQLAGDKPRTAKHIAQAAAEVAQPELPVEFAIVQRRLAVHGIVLYTHMQGSTLMFVTRKEGGTGIATPTWSNVTDRLEKLESRDTSISSPIPATPPPPAAEIPDAPDERGHISDRAVYEANERADAAILADVSRLLAQARQLLGTVKVAQWRAAQVDAQVAREQARAFLLDQRDRLTRMNPTAMISIPTYTKALDHLQTVLESTT